MEKTCSKCGRLYPVTDFNLKGEGKRQSWCRKCQSERAKTYYASVKSKRRKQIREWKRVHRAKLKNIILELKDVPCKDCKRRFPSCAMDFDHVRGKKRGEIGPMTGQTVSVKTILAEVAKCEVVCACCHRVRTSNRKHLGDSSNGRMLDSDSGHRGSNP